MQGQLEDVCRELSITDEMVERLLDWRDELLSLPADPGDEACLCVPYIPGHELNTTSPQRLAMLEKIDVELSSWLKEHDTDWERCAVYFSTEHVTVMHDGCDWYYSR